MPKRKLEKFVLIATRKTQLTRIKIELKTRKSALKLTNAAQNL